MLFEALVVFLRRRGWRRRVRYRLRYRQPSHAGARVADGYAHRRCGRLNSSFHRHGVSLLAAWRRSRSACPVEFRGHERGWWFVWRASSGVGKHAGADGLFGALLLFTAALN